MSERSGAVTPMMAQYLTIKADYPDALLLYRMGDFYEMFFDDALEAAQALDISLTKRGKHDGKEVPMCGVPVHSAESYLLTLIRKGFRVAVCEQLEDPAEAKKRGPKAVVRRDVIRLITPGTLTEEALLDPHQNNFLAAIACIRGEEALAWVDISTGCLSVMTLAPGDMEAELARLAPREVLIGLDAPAEQWKIVEDIGAAPTPLAGSSFESQSGEKLLKEVYNVQALDSFGNFTRVEISALGAIMEYLKLTQKGQVPRIKPPQKEGARRHMQMDSATRRNLELTQNLSGQKSNSLLNAIDRTLTAGGARLLFHRLSTPSIDLGEIEKRQDCVQWMRANVNISGTISSALRQVPDMDRALSRLALGRGGPRDLAALRSGLSQADKLASFLESGTPPERLRQAATAMRGQSTLIALLERAIVGEPPLALSDGGFVAPNYDENLDSARQLRDEGRDVIIRLQSDYAQQTDITSLKIKHNNVLGYFIETTANHAKKMLSPPLSEHFIHRQTTANSVRFTTVKLSELETQILNAGGQAIEFEKTIFADLCGKTLDVADAISAAADALAELDVACGLANLASELNWCRPIVNETRAFRIHGGRHPVVEQALRQQGAEGFISNSCDLSAKGDAARINLLTGPNMAGKSTYLRQCALIAILAQIGAYVPAERAEIGLVTQLFSRVGASDDLARGRSTFMVEMIETATILNQANPQAFVILDEIGRGTATYDGLSIAWATLEHLHDINRCRGLFATHYHEMAVLADRLDGASNATIAVREHEDDVIFLYEVKPGTADRSYGVQVARLAGLPPTVIARARAVLEMLEQNETARSRKTLIDDLPLFSEMRDDIKARAPAHAQGDPLRKRLSTFNPDQMSPLDALAALYALKEIAPDER